MDATLKTIYYILFVISLVVNGFLFFSSLFSDNSGGFKRSRIVLILASGAAFGFLVWAYRLGHLQTQFALGIGMIISALLVFGVVMLVGFFTGKTHWQ